MIFPKSYRLYFCIALSLHFILIAGYFIQNKTNSAGLNSLHVTNVYVSAVKNNHQARSVSVVAPNNMQGAVVTKPAVTAAVKTHQAEKPVLQSGDSALLALLHDAIAAHQVYPASAILQQQSGVVGLSFCLTQEGGVENLGVAHSSGFAVLDRAAVEAVKESNPLSSVAPLLKGYHCFSLDIQFTSTV